MNDVPEDPVAQQLATGLARVAAVVHLDHDANAEGLARTFAQEQILLLLVQRRPVYALADLAGDVGMTLPATHAAVGTLAREGLVELSPAPSYAPHDVTVALTDRGRAHAPTPMHWTSDLIAELGNLDADGQRRLLTHVTQHIRVLQGQNRIPVTRMCLTCRFFEGYAHAGTEQPHHCWLVDMPFGHQQLRLRCPDQEPAPEA